MSEFEDTGLVLMSCLMVTNRSFTGRSGRFYQIDKTHQPTRPPLQLIEVKQRHTKCEGSLRPHSFWDFSGRGIPGISIPNSTYSSSSGTEIILFRNKSPNVIQIYYHYSSYSCSFSYSTLWHETDRRILFQFYLFPKNVAFHSLFLYSTSSYSQKLSKGMQS